MRVTSTNPLVAAVLFVVQWIVRVFNVEAGERRARLLDLALLLVGLATIVSIGICIERWS